MAYTPKREEQLAKEGLIKDGIYDFEVVDCDDKPSKKGNDMYTLKLNVFDEDGNRRPLMDYIALGNNFGERKLRHAADACGILEAYESGNLRACDFQNTAGKLEIKSQPGNVDYPLPKNVVKDDVKRIPGEATPVKREIPAAVVDDDIPF